MSKSLSTRLFGPSVLALSLALAGGAAPALAQETAESEAAEAPPLLTADSSIVAWRIENTEIQADPSVTYGVLDNGMRYAIKRNTQPEGEASLRLMFEVGSRDEADGEEGAAHFLEHMAFNGSTNIPEGELVPMLERLGLAFGADTNAETWPHYTIYKLDLPNLDEETVASSFTILREMASELTIAPEAVERERAILISEYQVRNSPGQRMIVELFREIMADDRIAERLVAEPDAHQSMTADILRGFYHGFYRPERATLVVVGDVAPADIERRIEASFASWQGTGEAREGYVPRIAESDAVEIVTFVDPALPDSIELQNILPFEPATNTLAEFRDGLLDEIAASAINNRLGKLAREEGARALGGQASAVELFQSLKVYGVSGLAKDGNWADALAVASEEWRRAAEFGFTNSEVNEAKANILSNFETAAARSNSSTSAGIAGALAMSSLGDSVRQSPEQRLELYRAIADTITPEAVRENFLAKWGAGPTNVLVVTKAEAEGGEAGIAAVLDSSSRVALAAPEETVDKPFAYTDFGPAGKVVSDDRIEDLGIRAITFANGVKLNLKKTDFEPGSISVQAEVGNGMRVVTDRPGVRLMARLVSSADDLGQHPADELSRVLTGRQVGYGYTLSAEAVVLSSTTTPQDLQLQMQLMAAQITDTAFGASVQRQWESITPILATNYRSNLQELLGNAYQAILTDSDPRFGFEDPEVLGKLSMDDLKAVVGSQFAQGPIEVGIVGDIDEDAAIAAVGSTLGALERPEPPVQVMASVSFRESREIKTLYHQGEAGQGFIAITWPTDDASDQRSALTRSLLADVVQLEALRVLREELGATYTPSTISNASSVYSGYGFMALLAPADPEKMGDVSRTIRELVSGFSKTMPSADAIQRARQPVLERYERQDLDNDGWVGLVVDAQSAPKRLEDRRQRIAVLESITAEELQAAAKKYLTQEPIEIRVVPAPPVEAED